VNHRMTDKKAIKSWNTDRFGTARKESHKKEKKRKREVKKVVTEKECTCGKKSHTWRF